MGSTISVYAKYDHVGALQVSAPVRISGVQVGNVSDIQFEQIDGMTSSKVIVTLNLSKESKVPKNTIAKIVQPSMMAGNEVELFFTTPCGGDCIQNGEYISGAPYGTFFSGISSEIDPMMGKLQKGIGSTLDMTFGKVDSLFMDDSGMGQYKGISQNLAHLKTTLSNLSSTTSTLDKTFGSASGDIVGTMRNINSLTKNLADNNIKITQILANLDAMSSNLSKETLSKVNSTVDNLNSTITSIKDEIGGLDDVIANLNNTLSAIKTGDGALAMLLNDKDFAKKLDNTIFDAQLLLKDIRLHPERYRTVLSNKKKPYKANEEDPARAGKPTGN